MRPRGENIEYDKLRDRLTSDKARLQMRIGELEAALREAKEIVKVFHDMGSPKHMREEMWNLYQQSPEMKRLNAALPQLETPAEWGCSHTTNNGDRCVLPAGHGGNHSL